MTSSLIATAMTLVLTLFVLAGPASASHPAWFVDDECGGPTNYFFLGGPPQYWHLDSGDGGGGCHFWTATIDPAFPWTNDANWYLPVEPPTYHGFYYVDAWIDCDPNFQTTDARYRRYSFGTAGGSQETYHINQQSPAKCDFLRRVTTYPPADPINYDFFNGHVGGSMKMIDRAVDAPAKVAADYIWWLPVHP